MEVDNKFTGLDNKPFFFLSTVSKNICYTLLSVVLIILAYPPFDMSGLIFIALVPLLLVVEDTRDFNFLYLFVFTYALALGHFIFWLEGIELWIKVLYFMILSAWMLIYFLLLGIFTINIPVNRIWAGVIVAGAGTALSLISQKIINFDLFFYVTQYNQKWLLPIVRVFGAHFLTFLIFLMNYIIFQFIRVKKYLWLITYLLVILSALLVVNTVFNPPHPRGRNIRVCIVQPNQDFKAKAAVHEGQYQQDLSFYSLFNKDLFSPGRYDFIVWPEGVLECWILRVPEYRQYLLELAKFTKAYLILGAPDLDADLREYNTTFIISPQGDIERYDKENLAPLTEIRLTPGIKNPDIKTEYGKIDLSICWEALSLPKRTTARINFLLTDDLSLKKTYPVILHTRLAVFQALEKNAAVVVACNVGPSMMIGPNGRVLSQAPLFRPFILKGNIKLPVKSSFSLIFLFRLSCCLLLGLTVLYCGKRSSPSYKYFSPGYFVFGLFIAVILCLSSFYKMQQLDRQCLPQPEIINYKFRPVVTNREFPDKQKECLRQLMEYYGIYLGKYFTPEQAANLDINEMVMNVGFRLVEVPGYRIEKMNVPVMFKMNDEWMMVVNCRNGKIKIIKEDHRSITMNIRAFKKLLNPKPGVLSLQQVVPIKRPFREL